MTKNELEILKSLPLEIKIKKTKLRIEEWIRHYGEDGVYISFSGGKDSTVLLDLVRQVNPNIVAVYVDTGLEYPELKEFVKTKENVVTIRPEMSFKEVIEIHGYPIISKEQANYLDDIRTGTRKTRAQRLYGKRHFVLSKKYYYLVGAPFKISHKCCYVNKKKPIFSYEKKTGRVPILGIMASESDLRQQQYLKSGCNAFSKARPMSTPMAFWREEDVLRYIKEHSLDYASVYGDIVEDYDGKLRTTKCNRTGCVYCGFGIMQDTIPNRYQRLEETHPKLHKYCMENLGFKEVCEYMNIPYKKV